MKKSLLILFFIGLTSVFYLTSVSNAGTTEIAINQVILKSDIVTSNSGVDQVAHHIFDHMAHEYYIESMDEALNQQISVTIDEEKHKKTTITKHFFFVRPKIKSMSDVMVTFKNTTIVCLTGADSTCKDEVKIELDRPFHLYSNFFDFNLEKLNVAGIEVMFKAKRETTKWALESKVKLNNLFLFNWLQSVKSTLGLAQVPTLHTSLIFFKDRLSTLHQNLANKL